MKQQRILILDDDSSVCSLICNTATDMGIECISTTTPERFLGELTDQITLIVLDLVMPNIDGIEMLRLLSERKCRADIIVISGLGKRILDTAMSLASSLGLSVIGNLVKPFRLSELQGMMRHRPQPFSAQYNTDIISIPFDIDEFSQAIQNEDFVLHYQPQISIATGRCLGVEALVRWQHPKHGLIYPDAFIKHAENFNLIDRVTWVLINKALSEMGNLADRNGDLLMLSMNISSLSLRDLHFPKFFTSIASKYGVSLERLTLEITESGLISDSSKTLDVLARLRLKKVGLSIDDFGTGYSMMKQLRNVPATELKIDKSFVQNLQNDNDRVMVEKTIEIGRDLAMTVVGEGVETEEQLNFLRSRGCEIAQGYFFSKPLPKTEFLAWHETYQDSRI